MSNNTTGRWVKNAAHWGAFEAYVEDGRVTDIRPFAGDAHPSPLLKSMPQSVHSELRIDRPYVRRSYLDNPGRSDTAGRGREEFVPIDWDAALDLVAGDVAGDDQRHASAAHPDPDADHLVDESREDLPVEHAATSDGKVINTRLPSRARPSAVSSKCVDVCEAANRLK